MYSSDFVEVITRSGRYYLIRLSSRRNAELRFSWWLTGSGSKDKTAAGLNFLAISGIGRPLRGCRGVAWRTIVAEYRGEHHEE